MNSVLHRARWVMMDPDRWLENGFVLVENHRISSVRTLGAGGCGAIKSSTRVVDHGNGILMPALVNAHTHISLSGHARAHTSKGFIPWVKALMAQRNRMTSEQTAGTVQDGVRRLRETGTGLAGEFGPHVPVAMAFRAYCLSARVWIENLGNNRELPSLPGNTAAIHHAYAGHAPHTTSPALLKRIQNTDAKLGEPFCVHLAESREELEFLTTGKGVWAEFMSRMGIDFSRWESLGKRPVEMALDMGLLDRNTLAVHLLEITPHEMEKLGASGARICLCPRSNWSLHGKLPHVEGFLKAGIEPAIGTDSLASVPTLSLFDEMRFMARHYAALSPHDILRFATVNGAKALGCTKMGTLQEGNRGAMIYVHLDVQNPKQGAEALVSAKNPDVHPILDHTAYGEHHAL